ncbi:cytochrome P450 family protein [Streptomyces ginkgonis]|uniref:cytochrome P450 family protein n=1 Tax=Streptomyces ginkgonis TaxID=1812259 RepID=UPI002176EA4F|nr:cytochrome P450 [Streptomyces ginkgonis]
MTPAQSPPPFDPEVFAADPYGVLARLREDTPVVRVTLPEGTSAWVVTREADVRAWLGDPRLSLDKTHSTTGYRGFSLPPELDSNLLNMDGADHLRLRRLVSQAFTPRRVEELRPRIEEAAGRLADGVAAAGRSGPVDLVRAYAGPLPMTVIGDLFGLPAEGRRPFAELIGSVIGARTPDSTRAAVAAIAAFMRELIDGRRAAPGEDLLSGLIAARDEGDRLSESELVSLAFLIVGAGIENVTHLISGGVHTLLTHPGQLAAVRADPEGLLPAAVEELLRCVHPNVTAIRRFPVEDIEVGGTVIPRGETVLLALAAAHRDPARYPEPDRFDVRRADTAHLALGQGLHYCLGAPLARLQIRIALGTLLERFPALRLADSEPALWRTTFRSHAPARLPVLVTAGDAGPGGRVRR